MRVLSLRSDRVPDPRSRSPRDAVAGPRLRRIAPVALASVIAAGATAAPAAAEFTDMGFRETVHSPTPPGGVPATWGCSASMSVSPRGDVVVRTAGGDGAFAIMRSAERRGSGDRLYPGQVTDAPCTGISTAIGPDGRWAAAAFPGPGDARLPLRAISGPIDGSQDALPTDADADPARPGDALVAVTGTGTTVLVARRADGHLTATKTSASGQGAEPLEIAGDVGTAGRLLALTEDDYGAVTAVWTVGGTSSDGGAPLPPRVASATLGAAGYWSAPAVSAPLREGATPATAAGSVDRYGSVLVAYAVAGAPAGGAPTTDEAGVVERAGDSATWEAPQRLAGRTEGREIAPAASVLGTEGRSLAVFDVRGPTAGGTRVATVQASFADGSGRWGALQPVSGERPVAQNPGATATATFNAAQGVATVGWTSSRGTVGDNDVKLRDFYPWDGTWSRVYTVPERVVGSTSATRVLLGTTDHADTVLGLHTPGGTGGSFLGYDVTFRGIADDLGGPRMQPIDGDGQVAVGEAAGFSVDMIDLFTSRVGDTAWDFGDGTAVTAQYGSRVEHRWSTPGTKTVTATGYDDLGNASSVTKTVRVTGSGAATRSVAPATTRARSGGRVVVSRGTAGSRRFGLRVSRRAELSVALQRRVRTTVRRAGRTRTTTSWVPLAAVAVDADGPGTVAARVRSLKRGGTYRAVVRSRPGSDTVLKTTTLRLRRR